MNVAFLHLTTFLSPAVHGVATWECNFNHSSVCFITQWSLYKPFLKSCSGHFLAVRAGLYKLLYVAFPFFVALKHLLDVCFSPFALETACRDEEIKLQKWIHKTDIDSQHTQLHNSEGFAVFGIKLFQGLKATEGNCSGSFCGRSIGAFSFLWLLGGLKRLVRQYQLQRWKLEGGWKSKDGNLALHSWHESPASSHSTAKAVKREISIGFQTHWSY